MSMGILKRRRFPIPDSDLNVCPSINRFLVNFCVNDVYKTIIIYALNQNVQYRKYMIKQKPTSIKFFTEKA